MSTPLYSIPGSTAPAAATQAEGTPPGASGGGARTVSEVLAQSQAGAVIEELDRDLVGLAPIKARIRDIAALLVVDKLRMNLGLQAQAPSLHMSFTGNPGTGKTTVAMRMAQIPFRLGYVRKGHLVAVTRDDLVGQYIGTRLPRPRKCSSAPWAGCSSSTRPTTCTGRRTSATTARRPSRFCCR
jgi:MoxR-like ATPase